MKNFSDIFKNKTLKSNTSNVETENLSIEKITLIDMDSFQERIKVCDTCENLVKMTFSCKKCGCFMKIKARFKKSTCPIGKW